MIVHFFFISNLFRFFIVFLFPNFLIQRLMSKLAFFDIVTILTIPIIAKPSHPQLFASSHNNTCTWPFHNCWFLADCPFSGKSSTMWAALIHLQNPWTSKVERNLETEFSLQIVSGDQSWRFQSHSQFNVFFWVDGNRHMSKNLDFLKNCLPLWGFVEEKIVTKVVSLSVYLIVAPPLISKLEANYIFDNEFAFISPLVSSLQQSQCWQIL